MEMQEELKWGSESISKDSKLEGCNFRGSS